MNAIREYWTAADAPCASLTETVPGMDDLRGERWCSALAVFGQAATLDLGCTALAFSAWQRATQKPKAGEFLAASLGMTCDLGTLWMRPGAAAFAGVGRAEFADAAWQPLPPGEGAAVVTIPVLAAKPAEIDGPLLEAIDIIAIEPKTKRWASLTDGHDGVLGRPSIDSTIGVRIRRRPLGWLAGGGSSVPWLGDGCCILDFASDAAERLLLEHHLICEDRAHADDIDRARQIVRAAIVAYIPAGGDLYIAAAA